MHQMKTSNLKPLVTATVEASNPPACGSHGELGSTGVAADAETADVSTLTASQPIHWLAAPSLLAKAAKIGDEDLISLDTGAFGFRIGGSIRARVDVHC